MPSIITCTLKNNSSHFSEVHVNIKKQYIQWNLTTFIPANLESGYMSELAICQSYMYIWYWKSKSSQVHGQSMRFHCTDNLRIIESE